jgi:hypothetical protein
MADTIQFVGWALERPCPLRVGEGWEQPDKAYFQVAKLRHCNDALLEDDVLEGLWVTGRLLEFDDQGNEIWLPSNVVEIEPVFTAHGGVDKVRRTCAGCEANAGAAAARVAGCSGHLFLLPESPDLDLRLKRAVDQCGGAQELERWFLPTQPPWYGLWARSPLDSAQCRFLIEVFTAMRRG